MMPHTLRIGVTGHRDLRPLGGAAGAAEAATAPDSALLHQVFATTAQAAGASGVQILSSLADGADRIVARAGLHYGDPPGAGLQAVLPLTIEDYLADFPTDASRQEFLELLARCPEPVYLRSRRIAAETADPREQAALRQAAYELAGRYVADHCDLLIALWDGQPARGRGGTAEIVAYALRRGRRVIRIWDGKSTML